MSNFLPKITFTSVARRVAFAAAITLSASVSIAAPTARITASRMSGPAPLAVFFDATASGDSNSAVNPFRELGYRFTFGDAASGTWESSGLPKNEQIGAPLAAHVFETPGTYTIQVTAVDAAGASSSASVSISVLSADSVYSGVNTVCISRNSDFAGCPADARQVGNVSSWPGFVSGRRYLLHRGQDFTALGSLNFAQGDAGLTDAQLGAFGTGAKPRVADVSVHSGMVPDVQWNKRVVVMDLDAAAIRQFRGGMDFLLLRNNSAGYISFADAFGYVASVDPGLFPNPQNIFLVDNYLDVANNNDVPGISGSAVRLAILGNRVDRTSQHNIRLWQMSKTIIAHNRLSGRTVDAIRATIKLQSAGTDQVTDTTLPAGVGNHQRTSYVTVANNQLGSAESNIQWLAASAPQNNQSAEGLENVIWEDNEFRYGTNYADMDIYWVGRNMTERGNRNVTGNRAVNVGTNISGATALPPDWIGPYFIGQASMRLRFGSGPVVRLNAPVPFQVR
jgi:PKD repeat protein